MFCFDTCAVLEAGSVFFSNFCLSFSSSLSVMMTYIFAVLLDPIAFYKAGCMDATILCICDCMSFSFSYFFSWGATYFWFHSNLALGSVITEEIYLPKRELVAVEFVFTASFLAIVNIWDYCYFCLWGCGCTSDGFKLLAASSSSACPDNWLIAAAIPAVKTSWVLSPLGAAGAGASRVEWTISNWFVSFESTFGFLGWDFAATLRSF